MTTVTTRLKHAVTFQTTDNVTVRVLIWLLATSTSNGGGHAAHTVFFVNGCGGGAENVWIGATKMGGQFWYLRERRILRCISDLNDSISA